MAAAQKNSKTKGKNSGKRKSSNADYRNAKHSGIIRIFLRRLIFAGIVMSMMLLIYAATSGDKSLLFQNASDSPQNDISQTAQEIVDNSPGPRTWTSAKRAMTSSESFHLVSHDGEDESNGNDSESNSSTSGNSANESGEDGTSSNYGTGDSENYQNESGEDSTSNYGTGDSENYQNESGEDSTSNYGTGDSENYQNESGEDSTSNYGTGDSENYQNESGEDSTSNYGTGDSENYQNESGEDSTSNYGTGDSENYQNESGENGTSSNYGTGDSENYQNESGEDSTSNYGTGDSENVSSIGPDSSSGIPSPASNGSAEPPSTDPLALTPPSPKLNLNTAVTGPDGCPRVGEIPVLEQSSQQTFKTPVGPPISDFLEIFNFDITPDWVEAHWSCVTLVGPLSTRGYRVPISTGPTSSDLVGSLTYYFNNRLELEKITFEGFTGDLDRLLISLKYFQMSKRTTSDPNAILYLSENQANGQQSFLKTYFRLFPKDEKNPNKKFWITMELYPPEVN